MTGYLSLNTPGAEELGRLRVVFLARITVVVNESPLSIFIVDRWGTLIRLRCDKLTIDLFCQVVSEVLANVGCSSKRLAIF